MELGSFSKSILDQFYTRKGADGKPIESPEDVFKRAADALFEKGSADKEQFREALFKFELVPSSPILMNAGTELNQLSACFVLPVYDSMDDIYTAIHDAAMVHKSGGGTGFSFSRIRSQGSQVKTTGGVASGPLSFLEVFNVSTNTVKQGGKRRGANMGCLSVEHPDIREFIQVKMDQNALTNFNLSVGLTSRFLRAFKGKPLKKEVAQQRTATIPDIKAKSDLCHYYPLTDPHTKKIVRWEDSRVIMQLIAEGAWSHGCPGILMLDTVNDCSPTVELILSTNPCGEIPLLDNESCNLTSINVSTCMKDGQLDVAKLISLATLATKLLNHVLDRNSFPLEAIKTASLANRKIGIGIMGFADLCYKLGIRYGSDDSCRLASAIVKCIAGAAKTTSTQLYHQHYKKQDQNFKKFRNPFEKDSEGVYTNPEAFRAYISSIETADALYTMSATCGYPEIDSLWNQAFIVDREAPVYNLCRTTAAPTGTTGILADTSGGIEPNFALVYSRLVNGKDKHMVLNKIFLQYLEEHRPDLVMPQMKKMVIADLLKLGTIQKCDWADEEMKRIFVTSHDIPYAEHIKVMYAFQRYIDNSVSKTINLLHDATVADVLHCYELAQQYHLKGLTIYRDGSRDFQILATGATEGDQALATAIPEQAYAHDKSDLSAPKVSEGCHGTCQGTCTGKCPHTCQSFPTARSGAVEFNAAGFIVPRPRPRVMNGCTVKIITGCGKLYVNVNRDEYGLAEVFISNGKRGGCPANMAALSRLLSIALRSGIDPESIISQLQSIMCSTATARSSSECSSCPDAVARVMRMVLAESDTPKLRRSVNIEEDEVVEEDFNTLASEHPCPKCNAPTVAQMGCRTCMSCGWSKCG